MTRPMASSPDPRGDWLVCQKPRPDARLRLFCFPHAGVGASVYRRWALGLPNVEVIAIQAPGRENRIREAGLTSIDAIAAGAYAAIGDRLDRPFALFGHSMGGIVASEVARLLFAAGGPAPTHVVISSRRAPQFPPDEPLLHVLDDDALVAELGKRYGGIPAAVERDKDLLRWLLPTLRSDLTALETHFPGARAPMPVPMTVFGGTDDAMTPREHLEGWRRETSGTFNLRMFPGGHFYLEPLRAEVLAALAEVLA